MEVASSSTWRSSGETELMEVASALNLEEFR
jgi:hypothetical protein